MTKILLVTGHVGETDYDYFWSNMDQLPDEFIVDQITIKNKPKAAAQREIFCEIENRGSNYDYVMKLDADMTFLNAQNFLKLLQQCRGKPHTVYPVFDHLTGISIYGLHIFLGEYCKDVVFANDPTFTDKLNLPQDPYYYPLNSESLVDHCRFANKEQKVQFIWHRALKIRKSKTLKERRNALNQLYLLLRFLRKNNNDSEIKYFKTILYFALKGRYTDISPPLIASYQVKGYNHITLLYLMVLGLFR